MSKTQPNSSPKPSLKSFPTRELLIYWVVQIGIGLLLSIPNLESVQWIKDVLIPLENNFATFRTGFIQSSTAVASKLFLAIWWLAILPWGLIFMYRWSDGFRPQPTGLNMSYLKMSGFFAAIVFTGYMLGSLLSFHDHSYYWSVDKLNSPSRGDLVPALMSNGPLTLSIWCAVSSFLLVPCACAVPLIVRTLFHKLFKG